MASIALSCLDATYAAAGPPERFTLKEYSSLASLYGKRRVTPARELGPEKVVLLSFLASWCRPCIEELPEVVELSRQPNVDVWVVVVADERRPGEKTCRVPRSIEEQILPKGHPLAEKALVDDCGGFLEILTGRDEVDLPLNVLFGPPASGPTRSLKVLRGKAETRLAVRLEPELTRALGR